MNYFHKHKAPFSILLLFMIGFSAPMFSQYPTIEWKLDGVDTLVYQYEQEAYMPMMKLPGKKSAKTILVSKGEFLLIAEDSGGFFFELSSLEMEVFSQDSLGVRTSERKMNPPNQKSPVRNSDGKVVGKTTNEQDVLLNLIFPIPDRGKKPGKTTEIPLVFPFEGPGVNVQIHGFNRVQCTDNLPETSFLRSEINISDYEILTPSGGTMFCYLLGDGDYSFDTENGYYKSGKLNIEMAFGAYSSDKKKSMLKSIEMIAEMKFDLKRVVKI